MHWKPVLALWQLSQSSRFCFTKQSSLPHYGLQLFDCQAFDAAGDRCLWVLVVWLLETIIVKHWWESCARISGYFHKWLKFSRDKNRFCCSRILSSSFRIAHPRRRPPVSFENFFRSQITFSRMTFCFRRRLRSLPSKSSSPKRLRNVSAEFSIIPLRFVTSLGRVFLWNDLCKNKPNTKGINNCNYISFLSSHSSSYFLTFRLLSIPFPRDLFYSISCTNRYVTSIDFPFFFHHSPSLCCIRTSFCSGPGSNRLPTQSL